MAQRVAILVVFLVTITAGAGGDWFYTNVSNSPEPSVEPLVTFDAADGLHIAWQEGADLKYRFYDEGTWTDVQVIGQGRNIDFVTCIPCFLSYYVWIGLDNGPKYRLWDFGSWYPVESVPDGGVGPTQAIAVGKINEAHVVWAEWDGATQEHAIFHSKRLGGAAWSTPFEVARITESEDPTKPQIGVRRFEDPTLLLVVWMEDGGDSPGVWGREFDGSTWGTAERLYEDMGGRLDVDASAPNATLHLASNEPQNGCMCNKVWYGAGAPGSWDEKEDIGTGRFPAASEWPKEISIHSRWSVNKPHVVWRHESYDESDQLIDERLILAVKEDGVWSYDDQIAVGRNAHNPQVYTSWPAFGETVVVWSDDSEGATDIYMASTQISAGVESDPMAAARLRIFPNPTPRGTAIGFAGAAQRVSRVGIFDVSGRRVAALDPLGLSAGHQITWDGTNDLGRIVPAGTYYVRIGLEDREVVRPVIVVR